MNRDDDYRQPVSKDAGNPGDTGIEIEEAGGSGVYPMSGPMPKGDAPVRGEEAWGQGPAGEAGYEDSGSSEIMPPFGTEPQSPGPDQGGPGSGQGPQGAGQGPQGSGPAHGSQGSRPQSRDEAPSE